MWVHQAFKFLTHFKVKIHAHKAILICDNEKLIYLIKTTQVNQIKQIPVYIFVCKLCMSALNIKTQSEIYIMKNSLLPLFEIKHLKNKSFFQECLLLLTCAVFVYTLLLPVCFLNFFNLLEGLFSQEIASFFFLY